MDPGIAGHLLKTQLLEPHWEKKAGEVVALERATLYGIVVYNGRRVNFGSIDPRRARDLHPRGAGRRRLGHALLPFAAHNQKLIAQVQSWSTRPRRQDVLVDDELIFAFYDQQLPADVYSPSSKWYRERARSASPLLQLTRDELMRHEAAGITTASPSRRRCGWAASTARPPLPARAGRRARRRHRHGAHLIYALNQVNDERCEWLVPGMLKDKVLALVKSLHQRPRSPGAAARVRRRSASARPSPKAACSTRC